MTTSKPPIDFIKVESLRKHMLLTHKDMAQLFGVSRMTYYGWINGKSVRPSNDKKIRATLKKLLGIMVTHKWPMPEVIAAAQPRRMMLLSELMKQ